jgi:hypothetical protein
MISLQTHRFFDKCSRRLKELQVYKPPLKWLVTEKKGLDVGHLVFKLLPIVQPPLQLVRNIGLWYAVGQHALELALDSGLQHRIPSQRFEMRGMRMLTFSSKEPMSPSESSDMFYLPIVGTNRYTFIIRSAHSSQRIQTDEWFTLHIIYSR